MKNNSLNVKLSIIIPVYNTEKFLETCIESILRQNYTNWEIILINDGSTDNAGALCDRYSKQDNRILVIHQANSGLSAARNVGICHSTGDYVMFVDSDDWIADNCLEAIATIIEKQFPDIVIGKFTCMPETGAPVLKDSDFIAEKVNGKNQSELLEYLRLSGMYFVAWRYIIKRTLLTENSLYFFAGIFHEDEEWTPRLLCTGNSFYLYEIPFYCYRTRALGSIMSKIGPKHIKDKLLIVDSLERYAQQATTKAQKLFLHKRTFSLLLNIFDTLKKNSITDSGIRKMLSDRKMLLRFYSKNSRVLSFLCFSFGVVKGYDLFVTVRQLKKQMLIPGSHMNGQYANR